MFDELNVFEFCESMQHLPIVKINSCGACIESPCF